MNRSGTSPKKRDGVRLLLSGEGSSGKRPLADGRRQVPGGWNRIHLQVTDLDAEVKRLRAAGVPFRMNEIVSGPGGAQIISMIPRVTRLNCSSPADEPRQRPVVLAPFRLPHGIVADELHAAV
jgi:hypothetical protein